MENQYKVGNSTQYGTLLAEAVIPGESGRISSLYAEADGSGYTIREWVNSDKWDEYEAEQTNYANEGEARRMWIARTFGIII